MLWWDLKQLRSKNSFKRQLAAMKLRDERNTRAVGPLILALEDRDLGVQWCVIEALGEIGDTRAVEPLIAASKSPNLRLRAVQALRKINDPRAFDTFIYALRDYDVEVRYAAAKALEASSYTPHDQSQQALIFIAGQEWDGVVKLGPAAVEPLITALKNHDKEVRRRAAEALTRIGDPRAVEPLLAALKDYGWELRNIVEVGLVKMGNVAVEPLIAAIKNSEALWREAESVLVLMGAVEPLVSLLKDPNEYVRRQAGAALGRLGYKPEDSTQQAVLLVACQKWDEAAELNCAAVDSLVAVMNDPASKLRRKAAKALGKIGDARAVEPLLVALKDSDEYVRVQAALSLRALSYTPIDQSQQALILVARQKWGEAAGIGPAAVEPLIAVLKDSCSEVRCEAASALGEIGDARAVDPLIALLNDSRFGVTHAAAEALGKIGDAGAVEPLSAIHKDAPELMRKIAAEALERIRRTQDGGRAVPTRKSPKEQVRWSRREKRSRKISNVGAVHPLIKVFKEYKEERHEAAEALINIGAPAVEPIISLFSHYGGHAHLDGNGHSNEAARACQSLLSVLGKIGDARAVEWLIATLDNATDRCGYKHAVIEALGEIGDARAVEPLLAQFITRDVARALGKIGDARAVEPLINAFVDTLKKIEHRYNEYYSYRDIATASADALVRIGDARAVEPLLAALDHSEDTVRHASLKALNTWL